jgi:hypothetical protein
MRGFGVDVNSSNGPFTARSNGLSSGSGTFSIGVVRQTPEEFQAALDRLVEQGKAAQLGMHQSVIPNNMATTTSMLTTASPETGSNIPVPVTIETKITPTVNADGTITVIMSPHLRSRKAGGEVTQDVNTVANIRSGDMLALGGLRGPERDLILFLTARIIPAQKSGV